MTTLGAIHLHPSSFNFESGLFQCALHQAILQIIPMDLGRKRYDLGEGTPTDQTSQLHVEQWLDTCLSKIIALNTYVNSLCEASQVAIHTEPLHWSLRQPCPA